MSSLVALRKEVAWKTCLLAQRQGLEYELRRRAEGYSELVDLYSRHQAIITTTWNATTESQRRAMLKKAWPKMTAELTPDLTAPLTREYSLWPCLNLVFLAENPSVLLAFLYYRATNFPTAYVFADMVSAHVEKASPDTHFPWAKLISQEHVDRLQKEVAINFIQVEPYYLVAKPSSTSSPVIFHILLARERIEIQSHLYQVLANIAKEIMNSSGIPACQWHDAVYPRRRAFELTTPDSDGSESVLRWYYGPPEFNHARVRELIDAHVDEVRAHLLDLRLSPAVFDEVIQEADNITLLSNPSYLEGAPEPLRRFMAQVKSVTRAVQEVDKWTALQDFCYDMPETKASLTTFLPYMVFNSQLVSMLRFLFQALSGVCPGTDPTSSGYFDLNPAEKIGEKTQKLLQKTYNNLPLLRSPKIPINSAAAILDYLQRALKSPKCRVRPVVRPLLEALIVLAACQNHVRFYMTPNEQHKIEYCDDETINEYIDILKSHHQETWVNLNKKAIWVMIARAQRPFQHDVDEEQTSGDSLARQKTEQDFDKSWEELIDILDAHEGLSDVTARILRQPFCRPHWDLFEPEQTAEDVSESEECPKLDNTAFKCLWDETTAAQEERLRLELAAMRIDDGETQAQAPGPASNTEAEAEQPSSSDQPTPSGNPVILVSEDTFHVLRMLFYDPDNLNTEGELDWNDLVKAMEDIGFVHDGSRAGSRHSFKPDPSRLTVTSSIGFHDEHRAKISRQKARYFGKDMTRAYDWNLETFAIRPRLRV